MRRNFEGKIYPFDTAELSNVSAQCLAKDIMLQLTLTFYASLSFVLALQTNDLIRHLLDGTFDAVKVIPFIVLFFTVFFWSYLLRWLGAEK